MSKTCPKCGADNRESAKFCLKCAHQLVALPPSPQALTKRRKKRRSSRFLPMALHVESIDDAPRPPWRLLAVVGLLLAGTALWAVMATQGAAVAVDSDAAAARSAAAPQAMQTAQSALQTADLPPAAASASVSPSVSPAALAVGAAASLAVGALSPSQANSPAPSAPAPAPAAATRAAKPKPAAPARKPAAPLPPEPVPQVQAKPAPLPAPAPAPAEPAAPAALCSGSRFIAHAVCLQAECDKPGRRQHPQCVRMREQQQALQSGDR